MNTLVKRFFVWSIGQKVAKLLPLRKDVDEYIEDHDADLLFYGIIPLGVTIGFIVAIQNTPGMKITINQAIWLIVGVLFVQLCIFLFFLKKRIKMKEEERVHHAKSEA